MTPVREGEVCSYASHLDGEGVVQRIPLSPSELLSVYSVLDRASVEQMTYWSALVFIYNPTSIYSIFI